jgi:hypothetical protein
VYKTDRGLVRVGLRTEEEVIAAVQAFEVELRLAPVPVLVQPMATGVELALAAAGAMLIRSTVSRAGPAVGRAASWP